MMDARAVPLMTCREKPTVGGIAMRMDWRKKTYCNSR